MHRNIVELKQKNYKIWTVQTKQDALEPLLYFHSRSILVNMKGFPGKICVIEQNVLKVDESSSLRSVKRKHRILQATC